MLSTANRLSKTVCWSTGGTHFKNWGVGVRWGGFWQDFEGVPHLGIFACLTSRIELSTRRKV